MNASYGVRTFLQLALVFFCLEQPFGQRWDNRKSATAAVMAKRHRSKGIQWWNLAHHTATTQQMIRLIRDDPLHQVGTGEDDTPPLLVAPPPVHPLTRRQLKLVTKNPGTIVAVSRAARQAVDECQYQFRHRRWNCPVSPIESDHGGSIFGRILKKGCRETGFIYALTSAALAHEVARACSDGSIYTCSCGQQDRPVLPMARSGSVLTSPGLHQSPDLLDRDEVILKPSGNAASRRQRQQQQQEEQLQQQQQRRLYTQGQQQQKHQQQVQQQQHGQQQQHQQRPGQRGAVAVEAPVEWQWGGCSDNSDFGRKFSRDFIDTSENARDLRSAVNVHNNEAGRLHVVRSMRQECKCHGMSGSCAIKTCWMRLPAFRYIGDSIKDRFDGASRVDQGNDILREGTWTTLVPADMSHKPPTSADLVFFESSPEFCEVDVSTGFRGVRGRDCNSTSAGLDGCELMCCGHGYKTEKVSVRERCGCEFRWCCHVTCQTCTRLKDRHTCL